MTYFFNLNNTKLQTKIVSITDHTNQLFSIEGKIPEFDNEIAHKCYMGAGFVDVDEYVVKDGFLKGKKLHLMTRSREKQNIIKKWSEY